MNELIYLALLWLGWCFLHSFLIHGGAQNAIKKILKTKAIYFRLSYNIFSAITLVSILYYSHTLEYPLVFSWDGHFRLLQMLIILLALFLFAAGSLSYDFLYFSGMGQIREQRNSSGIAKEGRLETRGILRITRHPWYLAALIVIWPRDLNHAVILTNIILSFYIIIGTLLEEKKLVSEFREEYLVYQNEVSMLFPWKWLRKKFSFKLPRP